MSRARAQSGPTISLFPFLAVLLCTMGSLLVILVIFSRSAKQAGIAAAEEAEAQAAAATAAERGELELAREELGWRIDQIRGVRDRTAEELSKARMQLAGTEETARKLADELEALARTAEALEGDAGDASADETVLELERKLAEARQELDAATEKLALRPPAYAVVPYEGANGTHRRPLYIECCIDGVFLQPEGIRLGPADFEGPPGPGNPLASALRAAREYIASAPGESGDPNVQPYPLLLVRPSGVMAYYAARESIQSWGNEFGYQFIDEEWTINYPARDPALAEAEMRAIEESRRRLEWLAQVRPSKPSKPATTYRAATTRGGVVSNGGPSVLGDQSRFDWTDEQAGGADGRGGPGRGFRADGNGSPDGDGGLASGDAAGGDAILGNRYAGPSKFYAGGSGGGGANGEGSSNAGPSGGDSAGGGTGPSGGNGTGGGGPHGGTAGGGAHAGGGSWDGLADGGEHESASAIAGSAAPSGRGGAAGGDPSGSGEAGDSSEGTEGVAAAGGGGSGGSAGGTAAAARGAGSASSGGGGSGPSMPGLHQAGGGAAGDAAGSSGSMSASLSGQRGSNWASLATNDNPVPLTRPIKLECAANEFRILGDGGRVEMRIPVGTHTVDSVDPLVHEVHATVGRWGLAGDRMYWKPELVLSATPDGVDRRDDLEKLLADSGIDTRRSENKDKVKNLPPVQRTGGLFPRR
jgi:hypothetical protein